mmetsp:Transcript_132474/g.330378  ORF Transcript_132474/g.330378 Transcript_132474/m.330378 type:complete len:488 (-) Transcript_132474:151-1614(-)
MRSSSRRRRIRAELEAKQAPRKDAWAMQQQLMNPGASEGLMDAARQLLQPEDYSAVVEERALEGLCGFPPCTQNAAAEVPGKKWMVNAKEREVVSMEQVCRFCSRDCFKASSAWALRLEPDPAYVRPASAIASSRAAVAEATSAATATKTKVSTPAADEVASEASGSAPKPCQTAKQPLPKVRQKAVVRFSREAKTYTVDYSDYDGGGALPGSEPVKQSDGPAAPSTARPTKHSLQQLLAAPILERDHLPSQGELESRASAKGAAPPAKADNAQEGLAARVAAVNADGAASAAPTAAREHDADLHSGLSSDIEGSDDDAGDGFFDADAVAPGAKLAVSPFVRAWGVLSSWLTGLAVEVLRSGFRVPGRDEESRPVHKGRRDLLMELLLSRVPGDASFLARRFHDLAAALGVHQSLPSVTEAELWDLLAALLLRAVLQYDVRRGALDPNPYCEKVLDRQVSVAAQGLGISASELEQLVELLPPAVEEG